METERLLAAKILKGRCRIQEYIHVCLPRRNGKSCHKRLAPSVAWLKKGCCVTYFENSPEPVIRNPGDVIYIPPGRSKYSEVLEDGTEIAAATFDTGEAEDDLFSYLELPYKLPEPAAEKLRRCLQETGELGIQPWRAVTPADAAAFLELSARMLRILVSASAIRGKAGPDVPEKLRFVLSHLLKNFQTPQSVGKLAEMACLSRTRFHRRFKECFGMPPGGFLLRLRFREAEKLLLLTDLSISEIAFRTGWNDPLSFSRRFSACYGVSPAVFRKNPGAV